MTEFVWEKTAIYFSEQLSFHRQLSSSKRARARGRANRAKNDAQKACAMQLNGITLIPLYIFLEKQGVAVAAKKIMVQFLVQQDRWIKDAFVQG